MKIGAECAKVQGVCTTTQHLMVQHGSERGHSPRAYPGTVPMRPTPDPHPPVGDQPALLSGTLSQGHRFYVFGRFTWLRSGELISQHLPWGFAVFVDGSINSGTPSHIPLALLCWP